MNAEQIASIINEITKTSPGNWNIEKLPKPKIAEFNVCFYHVLNEDIELTLGFELRKYNLAIIYNSENKNLAHWGGYFITVYPKTP